MRQVTPLAFCLAAFEAWWQAEMLKSFPKDYAVERLLNWGSDAKDDARAGFIAAWKIRDRMETAGNGCNRLAADDHPPMPSEYFDQDYGDKVNAQAQAEWKARL